MRAAAVVVTWEGGAATERCVDSLLAQEPPLSEIVVTDNASGEAERSRLRSMVADRPSVRLVFLGENQQFAGGLNAGVAAAIEGGADRLLLLNNDVVMAPDAAAWLAAALDTTPGAGIAGPRVADLRRPGHVLSAGERHSLPLLCLPRTLLRYRRPADAPYPVSGVMGCALLVTRTCFEAVGGFSTEIGVYYEDVDFCVGARERGFRAVIEPRAVVYHDGLRGLASGLTPWAAFLKARNPWLLMRRRGGPMSWVMFVPLYCAMITASMVLYVLRGQLEVAGALARGAIAGVRAAAGAPLTPVGPPFRGA